MKSAVANKVLPFEVPELSVLERPISLEEGIRRSQANLLGLQQSDGHWEGELIADATLCCDYIIYMHWLGKVDEALQAKCAAHIRRRQLADGGWNIFIGGPSEINASVKAYWKALPSLTGTIPLALPSYHPAGNLSLSQLVLLQSV